jgi:heat shock protein HslJ
MKAKVLVLVLVCGAIGVLTACGSGERTPAAEEGPAPAAAASIEPGLVGTWELRALGPITEETPTLAGTTITLQLEPEGALGGSSGCNTYRSTFATPEPGEVTIRALVTTRMACQPPVMDQEQVYLDALATVSAYDVGADQLQLFFDAETQALVFERQAEESGGDPPANEP